MLVQAQPTKNNALVIDDRISRGVGPSAKTLLESLSHSTRGYYALSETLLKYPPAFTHNDLLIVDPSLFERFAKKALEDTLLDIYELLTWATGWNGYDAPKPDRQAVVRAAQWIINLFREVADLGWIKPNVTGGPEGGVVFEWWYEERKLTIYIDQQNTEYVQVWGTDAQAEITDGDIESVGTCKQLWMWLLGKK